MARGLDWQKARDRDRAREAADAAGPGPAAARGRAAWQDALAAFVEQHKIGCFRCGATQAEWAKTGIRDERAWAICVTCAVARKAPRDVPSPARRRDLARDRATASAANSAAVRAPELVSVTVYTDGACSGNGHAKARGGWAAILVHPAKERELSGSEPDTTNQRMELRAVIEGLAVLTAPCVVTVYSDSAYIVNCFRDRWYEGWRRNGWRSSKRQPVANRDLWEELLELVENRGHAVDFRKVAAHTERRSRASDQHETYNRRCDALAVAAIAAAEA